MRVIRSTADMAEALAAPIDDRLKQLLARHCDHLIDQGYDPADLVFFVVVEPGDAAANVVEALGFDPGVSRDDDARFGDLAFRPSWEWLEHHPGWTELIFVLSDDGSGCVLLVSDLPGVAPSLTALCRAYA